MMFDGASTAADPSRAGMVGGHKNSGKFQPNFGSDANNNTDMKLLSSAGNTGAKNTFVSQKDNHFIMNATQASSVGQRSLTVRMHDYMNKLLNPSR